jgi:hypothetical protein
MRKTITFGTLATLLLFLCTTFAHAEAQVGVKAGDWIKYDAVTSGVDLASTNMPQWVKIEFLSVTETTVTFNQTHHMSSGAEQSEIIMLDVASGVGNATFQILIPANSKTGDAINIITDEGNHTTITLSGEKTGNYAGATRTLVYASLQQGDTQVSYYWDKQTGVLLEIKLSQGSAFIAYKATSTNIWQASSSNPLTLPNIPIEILSISISLAAATAIITTAVIYTKRKRG